MSMSIKKKGAVTLNRLIFVNVIFNIYYFFIKILLICVNAL